MYNIYVNKGLFFFLLHSTAIGYVYVSVEKSFAELPQPDWASSGTECMTAVAGTAHRRVKCSDIHPGSQMCFAALLGSLVPGLPST